MLITTGRVNGRLVEIEGDDLPEGATVTILAPEDGESFLATPEEEAKLLAAVVEAARGQFRDATELITQIRP